MNSLLPSDQPEKAELYSAINYATDAIVSRALLQTPELRVTLFAMDAGQELTEHRSERRALVQVLEGTCAFQTKGVWADLPAGHLMHLPPGEVHAVRAVTPIKFLLIVQRAAEGAT